MSIRYIILSISVTFALYGSSYASSFIGIAADGSHEEFQIGNVRSIKFQPQKSGDKGFRTIVFNSSMSEITDANEKFSNSVVFVYPNPVSDYIIVSGIEESDEVIICGMDGKAVSCTNGSRVEVSSLPVGNYILSVKNQSVKFIKK